MNKLITLFLLCAVFMAVSACAQTKDTATLYRDTLRYGSINGYVFNYDTKHGVSWAEIILMRMDKFTGEQLSYYSNIHGFYTVSKIPVGEYQITVHKDGYHETYSLLTVRPNDTVISHFMLKPGYDIIIE